MATEQICVQFNELRCVCVYVCVRVCVCAHAVPFLLSPQK